MEEKGRRGEWKEGESRREVKRRQVKRERGGEGGRRKESDGEGGGGRRAYQEHSLSLLVCSLRWSQTHSAEFGTHLNTHRTCRHI